MSDQPVVQTAQVPHLVLAIHDPQGGPLPFDAQGLMSQSKAGIEALLGPLWTSREAVARVEVVGLAPMHALHDFVSLNPFRDEVGPAFLAALLMCLCTAGRFAERLQARADWSATQLYVHASYPLSVAVPLVNFADVAAVTAAIDVAQSVAPRSETKAALSFNPLHVGFVALSFAEPRLWVEWALMNARRVPDYLPHLMVAHLSRSRRSAPDGSSAFALAGAAAPSAPSAAGLGSGSGAFAAAAAVAASAGSAGLGGKSGRYGDWRERFAELALFPKYTFELLYEHLVLQLSSMHSPLMREINNPMSWHFRLPVFQPTTAASDRPFASLLRNSIRPRPTFRSYLNYGRPRGSDRGFAFNLPSLVRLARRLPPYSGPPAAAAAAAVSATSQQTQVGAPASDALVTPEALNKNFVTSRRDLAHEVQDWLRALYRVPLGRLDEASDVASSVMPNLDGINVSTPRAAGSVTPAASTASGGVALAPPAPSGSVPTPTTPAAKPVAQSPPSGGDTFMESETAPASGSASAALTLMNLPDDALSSVLGQLNSVLDLVRVLDTNSALMEAARAGVRALDLAERGMHIPDQARFAVQFARLEVLRINYMAPDVLGRLLRRCIWLRSLEVVPPPQGAQIDCPLFPSSVHRAVQTVSPAALPAGADESEPILPPPVPPSAFFAEHLQVLTGPVMLLRSGRVHELVRHAPGLRELIIRPQAAPSDTSQTLEADPDVVEALAGFTRLRTLVLPRARISRNAMRALLSLPDLRSLSLLYCMVDPVPEPDALPALAQLEELDLENTRGDLSVLFSRLGSTQLALRRLNVNGSDMTSATLELLLTHCPALEELRAEGTASQSFEKNDVLRPLFARCLHMRRLYLGRQPQLDDADLIQIAEHFPQLRAFGALQCGVYPPSLHFPQAEGRGGLSAAGLRRFLTACSALQELQLTGSRLGEGALAAIVEDGHSLTGLDIGLVTPFPDREALTDMLTVLGPRLHHLGVDVAKHVYDLPLDAIVQHCPNLRSLRLNVELLKDRRAFLQSLSAGCPMLSDFRISSPTTIINMSSAIRVSLLRLQRVIYVYHFDLRTLFGLEDADACVRRFHTVSLPEDQRKAYVRRCLLAQRDELPLVSDSLESVRQRDEDIAAQVCASRLSELGAVADNLWQQLVQRLVQLGAVARPAGLRVLSESLGCTPLGTLLQAQAGGQAYLVEQVQLQDPVTAPLLAMALLDGLAATDRAPPPPYQLMFTNRGTVREVLLARAAVPVEGDPLACHSQMTTLRARGLPPAQIVKAVQRLCESERVTPVGWIMPELILASGEVWPCLGPIPRAPPLPFAPPELQLGSGAGAAPEPDRDGSHAEKALVYAYASVLIDTLMGRDGHPYRRRLRAELLLDQRRCAAGPPRSASPWLSLTDLPDPLPSILAPCLCLDPRHRPTLRQLRVRLDSVSFAPDPLRADSEALLFGAATDLPESNLPSAWPMPGMVSVDERAREEGPPLPLSGRRRAGSSEAPSPDEDDEDESAVRPAKRLHFRRSDSASS